MNKGQKIQLERIVSTTKLFSISIDFVDLHTHNTQGYFICDRAVSDDAPMVLIKIPDGKSKLVAELEAAAKK